MNVEIRHIRAFLAIASELHFGKAANQINIAQPALSRTIQSLEIIVGTRLLERNTRSVQLTAAGQVFRDNCTRIMRDLAETVQATRRIGAGDFGALSVGYVDVGLSSVMPAVTRRFKRRFPGVTLELTQQTPTSIVRLLDDRRIDCGFLPGPIGNTRFDMHCIQSGAPVVVMPVSHRLALKSRIELADLSRERFVMLAEDGWRTQREYIHQACVKAGFMPQVALDMEDTDAILAFVAAEVGIGICSDTVQLSESAGIVSRPLLGSALTFDLYCAWHKDNTSRTLMEFAAEIGSGAIGGRGGRAGHDATAALTGKM